ncbi:MAG: DUF885 family protein [Chitinophagaceae bacterium]|nr:MAG: DUF885 family protein [Chitinophagaceae bacterium]
MTNQSYDRSRKGFFLTLIFALTVSFTSLQAQNGALKALYEQTSEMGTTITGYLRDVEAVQDFYSPYQINQNSGYPYKGNTYASPEQRKRLITLHQDYLQQLKQLAFDKFSIYGKVDYILLKKRIDGRLADLLTEAEGYQLVEKNIPFANEIYELEKLRRRGKKLDAVKVAAQLNQLNKNIDSLIKLDKKAGVLSALTISNTNRAITGLKARLKGVTDFYLDYDPDFTWWVQKPAEDLTETLTRYVTKFVFQAEKRDPKEIKGKPIGKVELQRQLNTEMIPYTPEQLIALAEKEFAFCDKELLKASAEMGFGKDWRKAQEKIKNSYVPLGEQPELIVKLQNDATEFIRKNKLINLPALAEETWGMVMMSAQRQLVNPFFTGGKEISISYPTQAMAHEDKLMSMRGNNPYFSRATVQHELLPGHHFQYFMNTRYKNYRNIFSTSFSGEGWALYWELLLYDKGFAKTPEERMGMLFWRMHRCARILFSLNYHMGNWTPQQSIDFLVDRVGHERANAEGEVRRSFEGGYSPLYQIAYLVGGLQIMALKNELVDSGKMDYPTFHDLVIKENAIPIELLRATLTNQPLSRDFSTQWKFYDFNK